MSLGVLNLPDGRGGEPQDVKISPDGSVFYVADLTANGVWKIDGDRLKVTGFVPTGDRRTASIRAGTASACTSRIAARAPSR